MTRTRSPQRTQFLADILATALEGGIQYWAMVTDTEQVDAPDDVLGWRYNSATIREHETGELHTVTLDHIAKGLNAYCKQATRTTPLKVANRTNGDEGDYDALDADQALQWGIFNTGIYA